ncbi:MAG: LPXTG cell wall anchor domain-containing protein [Solobacterium sp.]|nr:LPXTG cell wall anchor domain-containing protein [Solobacterium sp.]
MKDSEGNVRPAYNPKTDYEDVVTNEEGILAGINTSLGTGTYYLREKAAPNGYKKLAEDLCFTIGKDGTVTINNTGYANWLSKDTSVPGIVSYQIAIENTPLGITIRKTDEKGNALPGAKFTLCMSNGSFMPVNEYNLTDGVIDLTDSAEKTFTGMANGIYWLMETDAPGGYVILTREVYFKVSDGTLTLTDNHGEAKTYTGVELKDDNTTIEVMNIPGTPLPSTGGSGTKMFTVMGILLIMGAGFLLGRRYITVHD